MVPGLFEKYDLLRDMVPGLFEKSINYTFNYNNNRRLVTLAFNYSKVIIHSSSVCLVVGRIHGLSVRTRLQLTSAIHQHAHTPSGGFTLLRGGFWIPRLAGKAKEKSEEK